MQAVLRSMRRLGGARDGGGRGLIGAADDRGGCLRCTTTG
ncbi:hypothetical protein UA75_26940 [Actinoalloteichus sp. GBA129-24]|uniref:Uncharacterized protein n=1 Tax=Actinoalloteichus fjordicus TaxID=1612552 RepID=A0AAC9LH84_9PSEU|nr:hypothetical protein UA74_26355 [Actinoalloteichus fjordicus]APU23359.1 hypothetical protein UA75_26940 [Actinoalloteichus sp. GBA129-24]